MIILLILALSISGQVNKDQPGGYAIPSVGNVNALIIFTQFADDAYDRESPYWPAEGDPADMDKWIESEWNETPEYGFLTHYYNVMSFNKFKFTGKEISVTAPHPRQWYLDNKKNRSFIHKEILEKIDSSVSFEEFDNWTRDKNYLFKPDPDGIVDMIIFIWRNVASDLKGTEKDSIERLLNLTHDFGSIGGTKCYVDDSSRVIQMFDFGSGVTVRNYVEQYTYSGKKKIFGITLHEIGHYLIGHNNYHNGYGFWGMLASWGVRSHVPNSFERHRLGWIDITTFYPDDSLTFNDVVLTDYVTTGTAARLVIDSSKGEYFYLENHQSLSEWEKDLAFNTPEPGLYVLRKDNTSPSNSGDMPNSTYFRMIPADGRYQWVVNKIVDNPWGSKPDSLPVFKRLDADREKGYHDLEFIPWTYNGRKEPGSVIHYLEDKSGETVQDISHHGDGLDAFRKGYNEVFSPWSNPNTQDKKRNITPYGFYLKDFTEGVCTLDIYIHTAIQAPPSKPQGFAVSLYVSAGNKYPYLQWQSNTEPDADSYLLERKINGDEFKLIAALKSTATLYTDLDMLNTVEAKITYRIRAKDMEGNLSVYTEEAQVDK